MASLYKNNGIWYIAVSHNGPSLIRTPHKAFEKKVRLLFLKWFLYLV